MSKENGSNIFDAAGKWFGSEKKKKKPLPATKSVQPPPPVAETDVDDMLKKFRTMDTDLQNRMEKICQLSGMSQQEVHTFIENPNNFSPDQWQKMQKEKEALEEKIYTTVGIEAKKRRLKIKKKKMEKGRRGKTLGGRKRWIQM